MVHRDSSSRAVPETHGAEAIAVPSMIESIVGCARSGGLLRFGIALRAVRAEKLPREVEHVLTPFGHRFIGAIEAVRLLQEAVVGASTLPSGLDFESSGMAATQRLVPGLRPGPSSGGRVA